MPDTELDVALAYERSQSDKASENQVKIGCEVQQTPKSSLAFHQSQNAWVPYGSKLIIDYQKEFKNFITYTSTPNSKLYLINIYYVK